MPTAQLGTFEELLALTPPAYRPLMQHVRQLILQLHPEASEVVRLGDRAATYGLGPKKMLEGYAYLMPQAAWVNLGFYQGAVLPDPTQILEGTGAKLRHVKLRTQAEAERANIQALLKAARAERQKTLGR